MHVVCSHICVSERTCVGVPVHMSMNAFRGPRLHHFPLYSLRQGLSTECRAHDTLVLLAGLLQGSRHSLLSESWISKQASTPSQHYVGANDPHFSTHACSASALSTESSPQPPHLSDFYLLYLHALMCVCAWLNGWGRVHVEASQQYSFSSSIAFPFYFLFFEDWVSHWI